MSQKTPMLRKRGFLLVIDSHWLKRCDAGRPVEFTPDPREAVVFSKLWQAELLQLHYPALKVVPLHRAWLADPQVPPAEPFDLIWDVPG